MCKSCKGLTFKAVFPTCFTHTLFLSDAPFQHCLTQKMRSRYRGTLFSETSFLIGDPGVPCRSSRTVLSISTVERWLFSPATQWLGLLQINPIKDQYFSSLNSPNYGHNSPWNSKIFRGEIPSRLGSPAWFQASRVDRIRTGPQNACRTIRETTAAT